MHNSGITQARATGTLTEIAVRNGVDVATNNALMLAKGTSDIQIEQARELSKLKIEETQSLEQVRLDSYQQEVGIDLKAVLAQRLMVHETVLGIKTRLRNLIIEREEIETLGVTQATKDRLLADQDRVIVAFQENLRVKMERHLLESGDGKDVQGNAPADNG